MTPREVNIVVLSRLLREQLEVEEPGGHNYIARLLTDLEYHYKAGEEI